MDSQTTTLPVARPRLWVGWTMAIFTTVDFSTLSPMLKYAILLGLNPTVVLALRYVVSATLLAATIAVTGRGRLRADRRTVLFSAAAGMSYAAAVTLFSWSLTRIDTSVAAMVFAMYPLVVLLVLALRGERFTYRNGVRLALGLAGVYWLIGPGGAVDAVGALLVLAACLVFAFYLVTMQWFLQGYDAWTVALYVVSTMAVVTVGFWWVQGTAWQDPGWRGWLVVGWLAVVGTYVAQLTLLVGVRGIGSGQMALLGPVETLLTVVWSLLFLDERLTTLQWIGGGLILSSALLAVRRLGRSRQRPGLRLWGRM